MGDAQQLFTLYKRAAMAAPTNWFCMDYTSADPKWQFRTCLKPNEGGGVAGTDEGHIDGEGDDSDDDGKGGCYRGGRLGVGSGASRGERRRDERGRWMRRT